MENEEPKKDELQKIEEPTQNAVGTNETNPESQKKEEIIQEVQSKVSEPIVIEAKELEEIVASQRPKDKEIVKPRVLSLAIKEKAVLYAAYMPFLEEGGLFIPTNRAFKLGDFVTLLLTLFDEPQQITINGKVVWLTPPGAQGNKAAGIGVHFMGNDIKQTRDKIETYLAGTLKLERPTYTM